jgi:hypothetical protein
LSDFYVTNRTIPNSRRESMFIANNKHFSFNPEGILCLFYAFLHKIPSGLRKKCLLFAININSLWEFECTSEIRLFNSKAKLKIFGTIYFNYTFSSKTDIAPRWGLKKVGFCMLPILSTSGAIVVVLNAPEVLNIGNNSTKKSR